MTTNFLLVHTTYEDGTGSVPKRRNIKFRRRGIILKKEYNSPYFKANANSLTPQKFAPPPR